MSYYKRALSYIGLHRYAAAISDLNAVLAIQPDFSAALAQRGKLLARQGDFVSALKDLKKAHKQEDFVRLFKAMRADLHRFVKLKKLISFSKRLRMLRGGEIIKSALMQQDQR